MAQELPIVYVITVCRNAEALIEETMRSVLGQTYGRLRYVVVDGASTDGTMTIVRRYGNRLAATVSEPDRGIYDAMNKALGIVRRLEEERRAASPHKDATAWVNFMNAGDAFADADVLRDMFENNAWTADTWAVGGHTRLIYPDRTEILLAAGSEATPIMLPFCHQSSFIRLSEVYNWTFDDRYLIAADYKVFYQIYYRYGVAAIRSVDRLIANYRMDGSTTFLQLRRAKAEYLAIQSAHKNARWWKEKLKLLLHL